MPQKTIQVQGTKTWIADVPAVEWADCTEAISGIQAGAECLCTQALGDLTRSRAVNEYSCITNNDSFKSAGKMSYGDISIELLFDPDDIDGQAALLAAIEANTPVILAYESPDGIVSGSMVWTEALVTGDTLSYPVDGLVGYMVTISPYGGYNRCSAVDS